MAETRLVRLKNVPIRVEGKFGAILISQDKAHMTVQTKPDTGCQSESIDSAGNIDTTVSGHMIHMGRRDA